MKLLASCQASAALDSEVLAGASLPSLLLMEDASLRLWDALEPIARDLGAGGSGCLAVLSGAGNNAGDALALLRHARFAGLRDLVVILGRDDPGDSARTHLASLRALGVEILSWASEPAACVSALARSVLIVDGLAGTGLRGALHGDLAAIVAAANNSSVPIAAIDLPSGLGDGFEAGHPLIRARWTLSIGPLKTPLYFPGSRSACGEIIPVGRIFPVDVPAKESAVLLEEGDLWALLRQHGPETYKGARGKLAVFAGAIGSTGAASLASRAALGAGAGYVALFAEAAVLSVLSSRLESVMVRPAPIEAGAIEAAAWDVLLAGPGWGLGPANKAALMRILDTGMPAVLDADAISLYRELHDEGFAAKGPLILTPHPGEFAALTGLSIGEALANPPAILAKAAAKFGAVIAFKSHVTWIASPEGKLSVWDGMESGLATAGSGDVLAGLAGGLLASRAAACAGSLGMDEAYNAARAAVISHGLAGRRARARLGWFEASALIGEAAMLLGSGTRA